MAHTVQVRDVPEPVHAALRAQASEAGLSLNRFLLAEFDRIARRGRNAEILRRAARRKGRRATATEVVEALRAERDAR